MLLPGGGGSLPRSSTYFLIRILAFELHNVAVNSRWNHTVWPHCHSEYVLVVFGLCSSPMFTPRRTTKLLQRDLLLAWTFLCSEIHITLSFLEFSPKNRLQGPLGSRRLALLQLVYLPPQAHLPV